MDTASTDQRRFTRVPFDAKVRVTLNGAGRAILKGSLLDISFKGLMLGCENAEQAQLGASGTATIILSSGTVEFDMSISVRHAELGQLGLKVEQMPIETAEHLRALMHHNLGDETLLQREFHAMVLH